MILSKSSIDMLARIDAVEYDSGCYDGADLPQKRYDIPWMQELYEQYFWNNLRDIRGEHVIYA